MNNKGTVCVWGIGYIGLSNMIYYSREGIKTIGIDIDENRINEINQGKIRDGFEYWIGFDYRYLLYNRIMKCEQDYKKLIGEKLMAHLICVPTEKDGEPWEEALKDVIEKICEIESYSSNEEYVVIIESTMVPGTAEKIENTFANKLKDKELLFAVAPRRDWFLSSEKNLENLPRVYGGNNEKAEKKVQKILGIVCKNLVKADDYRQAEMTKSVENAIRHIGVVLANQLSDCFPEMDIRKVLELAATKWNIPKYTPSFGTGGYCIPLSSKYLLSADAKRELSLLEKAVEADLQRPRQIANLILKSNIKSVAILGICYKEDICVTKNSASLEIIKIIGNHGVKVYVDDPYFTIEEVEKMVEVPCLKWKSEETTEGMILFTAHREYRLFSVQEIVQRLKGKKIVWDNTGLWTKYCPQFEKEKITYKLVGSKGWKN